ncbi:MAG: 50S ribosomal protein L18 [Candidatus Aenigmatarchaeota archaeon]|nr:50S ribosomal protein L18 [Candidatus Aenigmarchaeota archaeon]
MSVKIRKIPHRRRREQKTDYRKRLALLKSKLPRAVIRKSLSHMNVQIIEYNKNGDKTLVGVKSNILKKFNWNFGTGNIPAAYLTGLLAGKKAIKAGIKKAVLDIGLQTSTKGSRIYAALKGLLDAGIEIPHDEKILPSEDRISGAHIKNFDLKTFTEVKEKILKGE